MEQNNSGTVYFKNLLAIEDLNLYIEGVNYVLEEWPRMVKTES